MPRFIRATEPVRIHRETWAENEEVRLRPGKTYEMGLRSQMAALRLPEGMTQDQFNALTPDERAALVDAGAAQRQLFRDMIVSMTDETGADVPVTDENLRGLIEGDGEYIAAEIDKLSTAIVNRPGNGQERLDAETFQAPGQ